VLREALRRVSTSSLESLEGDGRRPPCGQSASEGFTLKFLLPCPLTCSPGYSRLPTDPVKLEVLDTEVQQMADKGAIERVPLGQACCHSPLFLVPKKGGKWRPVIDLKSLNRTIDIPSFTMETPESIHAQIQPGDWAVSIDLSDAYFHIPINQKFKHFLTFCHRGTLWQFRALPFGLSTAQWIFTRVMEENGYSTRHSYAHVHR